VPEPEFDPDKIVTKFWRYSPPTRFGPKYAAELASAENLAVYLNASATYIKTTDDGNAVRQVEIRDLAGKSGTVTAKLFVLACGGFDKPRLMLASNGAEINGLGNRHDLVGRFFMEHLSADPEDIVGADPNQLSRIFAKNRRGEIPLHAKLCPADHLPRENRILSSSISVEAIPDTNSGVGAAKKLMIDLKYGRIPDQLGPKTWRILTDLDQVVPAAYRRIFSGEPLVTGSSGSFMDSLSDPRASDTHTPKNSYNDRRPGIQPIRGQNMGKAKARARAKAKSAKGGAKSGKPEAKGGKPDLKTHPGKFDPKTTGLKGASQNVKNVSTIRRGATRSR